MRLATVLLCAPLVLAGCSATPDSPPERELPAATDFAQGTCREAAPDLLELGRTLPRLGDDATVPVDVQQVLADVQDRLAPIGETAPPEVAGALGTLVERIGAVRIRAVGNSYEPGLGQDLRTSFEQVVSACTSV